MTGRRVPTRTALLRWRGALLALTALVLAMSWWNFREVHGTAETVRDRTAPAMLEAAGARWAVAQADLEAVESFRTGQARLTGPGERHRNQIAVAGQSLTQIAQADVGGPEGDRLLRSAQGALVAYTGWIEQADAHLRRDADGLPQRAAAGLWYASRLVHQPGGGILSLLDGLLQAQGAALGEAQVPEDEVDVLGALTWLSIAALLAALAGAQVFLRRRFRRAANLPLVLATALLLGLAVVAALTAVAHDRLRGAAQELREATAAREAQTAAIATRSRLALNDMVNALCRDACARTVVDFVDEGREARPDLPADDREPADKARGASERLAEVDDFAGLEPFVPIGAMALAALVPLAFRPRLEEYEYQKR